MLDLDYYYAEAAAGISYTMNAMRIERDTRLASVIMAAESLFTGRTWLDIPSEEDFYDWEVTLPMTYLLGEWSVKVNRESYVSRMEGEDRPDEGAILSERIINYRISK